MWLSRLELAADAPEQREFWREVSSPGGAHRALWKVFSRSKTQPRDFLFRQDDLGVRGAGRVAFFVLSTQRPNEDSAGIWSVETKPFSPVLREGDRLRFSLRASATVKRPREAAAQGQERRQGKRHDVVMDLLHRSGGKGGELEVVDAIQAAGIRWLAAKAQRAGFELDQDVGGIEVDGLLGERRDAVRVDGYRQHRVPRRDKTPIQFSTLDFEGRLVVRDPELFLRQLTAGFGPQKAFGCGLMLLRRV